jgi:hypothetical protein
MSTTPLIPYDPRYSDIYTDVERSLQQTFQIELAKRGWLAYPVMINQVDEKGIGNKRAALTIMKSSDTQELNAPGGFKGVIRDNQGNVQPYPKWFSLVYQLRVTAQNGVDVRNLDALIRDVFPPRGSVLWLWDSQAQAFTNKYVDYEYAGYINRDNPDNSVFDRITNMRFQVPSYAQPPAPETKITDIDVSNAALDFELTINSGS